MKTEQKTRENSLQSSCSTATLALEFATLFAGRHDFIGTDGGIPERPKGSDCKSDGSAFEGSNPSPSTILSIVVMRASYNGYYLSLPS